MRVGFHVGPVWVSTGRRRYHRRHPVLAAVLAIFWLAVLADAGWHRLFG